MIASQSEHHMHEAARRVEQAVQELRAGRMIIVTDDADRESEGDLMVAAIHATQAAVNRMATDARGLICCAIDAELAARLNLTEAPEKANTALHGTAFTESVDWVHGTTTGISAADRAATFRGIAEEKSRPKDFARPGHVFPIIAKPGGVLERKGHTEAAVDLCRQAGLPSAGVICEIMNPDGTMAHGAELEAIAERTGLALVSVDDIMRYRRVTERLLTPVASAALPTRWGTFTIHAMQSPYGASKEGPLVLTRGARFETLPCEETSDEPLLVRVHSECLTGDTLGSLRCDCGEQLAASMQLIGGEKEGAVIYLRQEGRGIGLASKLKAYALQDEGLDTVEANQRLGFPADLREYWEAAQILRLMRRSRVRLLTNNPGKVSGLEEYGVHVVERLPLRVAGNPHNMRYLRTKRDRLGHAI